MDSLDGGVFLSQLIYWSDHAKREDGFFYKTAKDWHDEIYISKHQINKHTKKLCDLEIVETKKIKANGSPTLHYKLNIERLALCLSSFFKNLEIEIEKIENGKLKISKSISKNSQMESESFENGNQKNEKSICENSQIHFEKIKNRNANNSISLTKITTKNTTEITQNNTTGIIDKDYQQKNITKNTAEPPPTPSITNSINRELAKKTSSKDVGGRSVPPLDNAAKNSSTNDIRERLEKIIGHYTCIFGEPAGGALDVLKFMATYYKDVPLICEAITIIDEHGLAPTEPYSEIVPIVKHWKDQFINSYTQLDEKKQQPHFTLLPSDEVIRT